MRFLFCFFIFVVCVLPADLNAIEKREKQLLGLHYIPASYSSLSRLTWRFNMHPLSYDDAIDEYLRITNCPLYQDYFEHDFLWQRIREGVRREIRYYASNFPDRFEMVGGVELGRYDFQSSAFIVPELYRLNKAGFLEIPTNQAFEGACRTTFRSMIFPPFMKLAAENPFTLEKIPVSPEEAKPLIDRLAQYKYKNIKSTRMAVMRVRVHMTGIREYKARSIYPELIFKGQLDEIAIFEDPAMTKLIWKKNFKALD